MVREYSVSGKESWPTYDPDACLGDYSRAWRLIVRNCCMPCTGRKGRCTEDEVELYALSILL